MLAENREKKAEQDADDAEFQAKIAGMLKNVTDSAPTGAEKPARAKPKAEPKPEITKTEAKQKKQNFRNRSTA